MKMILVALKFVRKITHLVKTSLDINFFAVILQNKSTESFTLHAYTKKFVLEI